jgi:outer membrane protein assembly factor BamA
VVVDSQDIVMRREGDYGVRYWISAYRSGEVFGSAGYLSEERYWTGWVKLRLLNLMNSGRKVEGEWRSFRGFSYYSLNYSEPWIFRLPVELQGSVEHNVLDTSYSFTTLSVTGTYTTGNTSFSVGAGFDRIAGIESNTTSWLGAV